MEHWRNPKSKPVVDVKYFGPEMSLSKIAPLSWIIVILAVFLLWLVPSTRSSFHREGEELVAHYHRVSLGLLYYSEVKAWRSPEDPRWMWRTDIDRRALLLTMLMSLPVVLVGGSNRRKWRGRSSEIA